MLESYNFMDVPYSLIPIPYSVRIIILRILKKTVLTYQLAPLVTYSHELISLVLSLY